MAMTIRQLAAMEYGHGQQSAQAEQELWDNLPLMDVARAARIIKAAQQPDQYRLVVAVIGNATSARVASLRALFTTAELQAISKR